MNECEQLQFFFIVTHKYCRTKTKKCCCVNECINNDWGVEKDFACIVLKCVGQEDVESTAVTK